MEKNRCLCGLHRKCRRVSLARGHSCVFFFTTQKWRELLVNENSSMSVSLGQNGEQKILIQGVPKVMSQIFRIAGNRCSEEKSPRVFFSPTYSFLIIGTLINISLTKLRTEIRQRTFLSRISRAIEPLNFRLHFSDTLYTQDTVALATIWCDVSRFDSPPPILAYMPSMYCSLKNTPTSTWMPLDALLKVLLSRGLLIHELLVSFTANFNGNRFLRKLRKKNGSIYLANRPDSKFFFSSKKLTFLGTFRIES